ncbi:MAG TPA: ABC transporter ATP-binding protein [Polyangia bacterium]|nr:ABC transporter ATP-binding protein [Polyangia bacterium]
MIQVEGLSKYYGEQAAIRDLTFSIERGEVIGFLGLNGAGKSTTLKVLGCVLLPTCGRVVIDSFDLDRDPHEIRKRIGFLPENPPLYGEMTVARYLEFVAQLRGVPASQARARADEAASKTALREAMGEVIGTLSHGFRQRVGLAQALVNNPTLLILDEPTAGLDPVQIVEMRTLIRALRGAHTILLSSHILSEISQTCDRLLVIQAGEIVAQGSEADLAARMGARGVIELEVRAPAERALAVLRAVDGVAQAELLRQDGEVASLRLAAPADLRPKVVRALVAADLDLLRIDRGAAQLESIFLQLTQTKEPS